MFNVLKNGELINYYSKFKKYSDAKEFLFAWLDIKEHLRHNLVIQVNVPYKALDPCFGFGVDLIEVMIAYKD